MEQDELEALLHKCHKDELAPLAKIVGVRTDLGLGATAAQCALGYRRRATHGIDTIYRGEPRSYRQIIQGLAISRRLRPGATLEETELIVVRDAVRTGWNGLSVEDRQRVWRDLGLSGDPPPTGEDAIARIEKLPPVAAAGYVMSQLSAGTLSVPATVAIGLLGGCLLRWITPLFLLWWLAPDEAMVFRGALEIAKLRQIVLHRVTIGVVGSPSTGKDAAIKALFGLDTGNVSPIAGSTKEVAIQRVPGATALYLVNTPGMGDVVERVTEEARQVLDHIDVYLYLVNAEGGVQAREKADYDRCVATGKPVLAIVNKIDVLRPRDKDAFIEDTRRKLGARVDDFVAAAFDPLPQLAPGPINREVVREWLATKLIALGKDPAELPPLATVPSPSSPVA